MGTGEEAFVVSVYCDITINHVPLQHVQLLEDKNDRNILISMDANAHSPMWGSLDSNSRGDMIAVTIEGRIDRRKILLRMSSVVAFPSNL